ncbi:MAG: hypothetical protein ACE15F_00525 [bacterium]
MSRSKSETRVYCTTLLLTVLLGGALLAAPAARPGAEPFARRVILLWDGSQSMVKRLDREKIPPATVWMARDTDLERLERYVYELLFHDSLPPVTDRDMIDTHTKAPTPPLPLADENTLLTAYLFNSERAPKFSMRREILPPGPDREERLRQFLPRPNQADPRYMGLETNLVRPLLEAVYDPEITGRIVPHTDQTYLVMVTDDVQESLEPYTDQSVVQKHLELDHRRQKLLTYVVSCQPSLLEKSHQILISLYQIFDKPIAATPTPLVTAAAATPTPESTPTPVPDAGPPPPAVIKAVIPPDGLAVLLEDGRLISSPFRVEVDGNPSRSAPLPSLDASLLDQGNNVIATGRLEFPNATALPAEGRLVFATFSEKGWPAAGRLALPAPAADNQWIQGVNPLQFPARFQSHELLWLMAGLLGLAAAGSGGLAYARWRLAPPRSVRIQFTLNPNSAAARKLKPLVLQADEPVTLGEDERADGPAFPVNCEPLTLVYERGWFSGKVRIYNEGVSALDSTGPDEEWAGESIGAPPREWTIPLKQDEGGSRLIVLREADSGSRTWEVRVEARPGETMAGAEGSGKNWEYEGPAGG